MRKTIFILIFCVLQTSAMGQQLLKGIVVNGDEVPISGVRITEKGTHNSTFTHTDGSFYLFFYSELNKLTLEHPDYITLQVPIDSSEQARRFYLSMRVKGNVHNLGGLAGFTDFVMKNPNKRLQNMPYFLGEGDVNRQLQMLPAVEHGNEGYSNLIIRGGNVDENLMLYNGTPVYNYNHLFGLSSLFHNNSIANVKLYKGIAPSQYGGRISSVIALETPKEADYSGMEGEVEVSTVSAGIYLRFIERNKSYFTISARRSWMDLLLPEQTRQNDINAYFNDVQINYGKTLKNNDALEFNFMRSKDYYLVGSTYPPDSGSLESIRFTQILSWSNLIAAFKYKQRINKTLNAQHSVHFTTFNGNISQKIQILNALDAVGIPTATEVDRRGIREYIGKSHWTQWIDNRSELSFGAQVNVKTYRPAYTIVESVNYPNTSDDKETYGNKSFSPSFEFTLYGEYSRRLNEDLQLVAGVRLTQYIYKDLEKLYPEPRIHFTYRLDTKSVLKLGYNRHHQFTKLINTGGTESPANFWVPATDAVRPYKAHVVNLSYERKIAKQYLLSVDGYYKQMDNIHAVNNFWEAFNAENDWQNQILQGNGTAYGLELMMQKSSGIVTGWLSYVYSKSTRFYDALSEERFPFDFDRRHMAKLYINVDAGSYWDFGVNYLIGSGQLFSIPDGKFYDLNGNLQLEYSSFNNYRSPFYHRLDLSVSKVTEHSVLDQRWKFYVYNLYGARNAMFLTPQFDNASLAKLQIERGYIYFMPGVAYTVVF